MLLNKVPLAWNIVRLSHKQRQVQTGLAAPRNTIEATRVVDMIIEHRRATSVSTITVIINRVLLTLGKGEAKKCG